MRTKIQWCIVISTLIIACTNHWIASRPQTFWRGPGVHVGNDTIRDVAQVVDAVKMGGSSEKPTCCFRVGTQPPTNCRQNTDVLLIREMPAHSRGIRSIKKKKRVLLLSSVRASTIPTVPATRVTFDGDSNLVLAKRNGEPDNIEVVCPKQSRRNCGKDAMGEFFWTAALNKQFYASQHGYSFILFDSNDFQSGKRTGEFAKPHMMKYALRDPDLCGGDQCDFIFWSDADSFIHPALFDLPLDSWLHDVPEDRILVLGNRVALNTGVFFLRADSPATRRKALSLVDDWIAASELIHCHAFDQAALQLLLLRAIRKHEIDSAGLDYRSLPAELGSHLRPFGFTCVSPWCSQNLTKNRKGETVPFWSCNPLFDKTLIDTGWHGILRGEKNFPRLETMPLWVTKENSQRPRLHVVEKHKLDSNLGAAGTPTFVEGWDYGGNFPYNYTSAPHSPTYFINHHKQTAAIFFEGHQSRRACGQNFERCMACAVASDFFVKRHEP
jgi:hypothetical protein